MSHTKVDVYTHQKQTIHVQQNQANKEISEKEAKVKTYYTRMKGYHNRK